MKHRSCCSSVLVESLRQFCCCNFTRKEIKRRKINFDILLSLEKKYIKIYKIISTINGILSNVYNENAALLYWQCSLQIVVCNALCWQYRCNIIFFILSLSWQKMSSGKSFAEFSKVYFATTLSFYFCHCHRKIYQTENIQFSQIYSATTFFVISHENMSNRKSFVEVSKLFFRAFLLSTIQSKGFILITAKMKEM